MNQIESVNIEESKWFQRKVTNGPRRLIALKAQLCTEIHPLVERFLQNTKTKHKIKTPYGKKKTYLWRAECKGGRERQVESKKGLWHCRRFKTTSGDARWLKAVCENKPTWNAHPACVFLYMMQTLFCGRQAPDGKFRPRFFYGALTCWLWRFVSAER